MSDRLGNYLRYDGKNYIITQTNMPFGIEPQKYGLTPVPLVFSDVHERGWCEYHISENSIVLESIYVNSASGYPPINGIAPTIDEIKKQRLDFMGYCCYKGVKIEQNYTGKMIIGRDIPEELRRFLDKSIAPEYFFNEVQELTFDNGQLVKVIDQSYLAEQWGKNQEFWDVPHNKILRFLRMRYDSYFKRKAWWIRY